MSYNLSLIQNVTTVGAYPLAVNEWTGGWFGFYIPIIFFFILLLVWRNESLKTAFIGASLVATFIATLEFFFGILDIKFVMGVAVVSIFASIFVLFFTQD